MIPNVNKGGDMRGLLRYLVDTRTEFRDRGRNVHTNPHVVGGDGYLMAMYETTDLATQDAHDIAAYLDEPRRAYGTEIRTKVWTQDEDGRRVPAMETDPVTGLQHQQWRDENVWHCSLSLPGEDGALSNEQWESITGDFMDRMGFTDASGRSPARWVAIHHGQGHGGHDHVHIAASMVREDGTRWEGRFRDFKAAQDAARDIERRYGLSVVAGREHGTAARGYRPGDRAKAEQLGISDTPRQELAHRLRSAAVASTSEAEWIRRVRSDGMVIKPYFASGTADVVTGYRVALKPKDRAERLRFIGGGNVAKDLSLPRVRENWQEPTVESAQEAADEWQAAFRGKPPTRTDGRETRRPASSAPDAAAQNFAAFNARLAGVPTGDRMAWADAARDVAGALSAWAKFDPDNADALRQAAAVVARSAQERRRAVPPGRRVKESPMGTAFLFTAMKRSDKPQVAAGVLLRQVLKTAEALRDYHVQTRNTRQAEALRTDVIERLRVVPMVGYAVSPPEHMTARDEAAWRAHQVVRQGQEHGTAAPDAGQVASPLPNQLAPRREDRTAAGGAHTTREDRDGSR